MAEAATGAGERAGGKGGTVMVMVKNLSSDVSAQWWMGDGYRVVSMLRERTGACQHKTDVSLRETNVGHRVGVGART